MRLSELSGGKERGVTPNIERGLTPNITASEKYLIGDETVGMPPELTSVKIPPDVLSAHSRDVESTLTRILDSAGKIADDTGLTVEEVLVGVGKLTLEVD